MQFKEALSPKKWFTKETAWPLLIFFLALIIRLTFVHQTYDLPDFRTPTPGLDTCVQWEGARHIRMGTPDPCLELMLPSAPGHVYFIAFCQSILGEKIVIHRIFRAFLGSFSILFIFLITYRISKNKIAAFLSGLAVACLPSWIYFDTMIIKASPEIFFICLSLWLILRLPPDISLKKHILFGCLMGAIFSMLRFSQGATILYVLVIAIYFVRYRVDSVKSRWLFVTPMILLLILTQIAFSNRDKLFNIPKNRFLPVSGIHMRIGFQKGAIGTYHVIQRFPALPLGHTFFSRMAAEALEGRPLTPEESNQSYINEAKTFIRENPQEAFTIVLRKIGLFFNNVEPAGNHYIGDIKNRVPIANLPMGYGALLLLSLWGTLSLRRKRQYGLIFLLWGLVATILIPNILGFVTWRYRLHATIPLAILFGPGALFISNDIKKLQETTAIRRRTIKALVLPVCTTCAIGFLTFRPVLKNAKPLMIVTGARNLEQSIKGEDYNERIRTLDSLRPLSAQQKLNLSTLLHGAGRYTASFTELIPVIENEPEEIGVSRQYIVYLMWQTEYDKIVDFLASMVKTKPQTVAAILRSFESDATFWNKADKNLKLITQSLMRDIVLPKLNKKVLGVNK